MIDLDSFLSRMGLTKAGLSRSLGMDPKTSIWASYEKGRSDPSFEVCRGLLKLGMTVEELFGVEYNKIHGLGGKIKITNEDISNAMLVAAELLRNQKNENSPASENNESVDAVNDSIENG